MKIGNSRYICDSLMKYIIIESKRNNIRMIVAINNGVFIFFII